VTKPRIYTRCHRCGVKFGGPRSTAFCGECSDGQVYFWTAPYAPATFEPIKARPTKSKGVRRQADVGER
jgi:hypothetical protein